MVTNSRLVLSLLCAAFLSSTFLNASPIEHDDDDLRQKRDLMLEMDENDLRNLFGGSDFDDGDSSSELVKRRKRDLMIADDDEAGDIGRWLLEHYDGRASYVDELPIGKRSGAASSKDYSSQQKKSGKKPNKLYIWFPDDTKHARRPHASRLPASKGQQKGEQQVKNWSQYLSDTFKFK